MLLVDALKCIQVYAQDEQAEVNLELLSELMGVMGLVCGLQMHYDTKHPKVNQVYGNQDNNLACRWFDGEEHHIFMLSQLLYFPVLANEILIHELTHALQHENLGDAFYEMYAIDPLSFEDAADKFAAELAPTWKVIK